MLTVGEILVRFQKAFHFEPLELTKLNIAPEGTFLEKLNARLSKLPDPTIRFTSFTFIGGYEIGDLTGNELLRLFIQILNNKEECSVSNCISFTVDKKQCAAMVIYKLEQIEVTCTPPPMEELHNRFIFSKLFDDDIIEENRLRESEFYTEEFIEELRRNISDLFEQFLQKRLNCFRDERFSKAFIGVIFEIAKVHANRQHRYKILNTIPVAACVKLALDSQQSGKLQRVFGQHGLNTKEWATNAMKSNPAKYTKQLSKYRDHKDIHVIVLKQKANLRMQAATAIFKKACPPNKKGFWDESVIDDLIEEMKQLYQIN